jgi:1-acyl-sn-glycerol-3-phosphate acyltransferase
MRTVPRGTLMAVRAAATLLFFVFALLVLSLTLPVTALVRLVTLPLDRHGLRASRALRLLGEILVTAFPFWRVSVEGTLPAPPATFVLVPNHCSMVDALAVARLPREMKWIGKQEAFRIPWVGWALRIAGHVPVDRGDRESGSAALATLRRYLEAGIPVGLFAEGTRSRDGTLRPFRAGPFKLAIEAGVPIVPVAITGAGEAMPPDTAWIRPSDVRVRILTPIATVGLGVADVDRLREETRTRIAEALASPAPAPARSGSGRPRG